MIDRNFQSLYKKFQYIMKKDEKQGNFFHSKALFPLIFFHTLYKLPFGEKRKENRPINYESNGKGKRIPHLESRTISAIVNIALSKQYKSYAEISKRKKEK